MESAPARAQSRIPPFRLSKTVQPAPHKGQRRWLPHFSGQSSSADAKNGAKKRVFPKCLLSPRGTRAAGHSVSTHTMLRAALKPYFGSAYFGNHPRLDTHNAACGIETIANLLGKIEKFVSTHTMLRAALKQGERARRIPIHLSLDTHNAACGIETQQEKTDLEKMSQVSTHTMLRAALTAKRLCVSFRSHRAVFVCKKRTAILTMRRIIVER